MMVSGSGRHPLEELLMSHEANKTHDVRVHIDRKPYESPSPTTGEALYRLAGIGMDRELFREVQGDHEDELIRRDESEMHLHKDEHFYSQPARAVTIIVNLDPKPWDRRRISYEEVTLLAFPNPPPGIVITYTVEYNHGPRSHPEGSLTVGTSVKVRNEMNFSVTETGRS
jgi:Multiubiquitin